MPPNPPSKCVAKRHANNPTFPKIFNPPRNEILDTPLLVIDMSGARSKNYYWKWLDRREEVSVGFGRGGGPLLWHVLYELIFVSGVRVSLTSGKGYVATGLPKLFQGRLSTYGRTGY